MTATIIDLDLVRVHRLAAKMHRENNDALFRVGLMPAQKQPVELLLKAAIVLEAQHQHVAPALVAASYGYEGSFQ